MGSSVLTSLKCQDKDSMEQKYLNLYCCPGFYNLDFIYCPGGHR